MSKHTPGPWGYITSSTYGSAIAVFAKDDSDPSKKICHFPVLQDGKESIANACLISAAPEMLDALKTMQAKLEYLDAIAEDYMHVFVDEWKKINKAINKAEGKDA